MGTSIHDGIITGINVDQAKNIRPLKKNLKSAVRSRCKAETATGGHRPGFLSWFGLIQRTYDGCLLIRMSINCASDVLNCVAAYIHNLRTLTTWHCPHSPAAVATIDWYLLPVGPTAANLQQRVGCCGPCWERWMDRQTDTIPFHRPYSSGFEMHHWVL